MKKQNKNRLKQITVRQLQFPLIRFNNIERNGGKKWIQKQNFFRKNLDFHEDQDEQIEIKLNGVRKKPTENQFGYQSVKGENRLNSNQNAAYDIKIKYHNFYHNVAMEESDQLGSDLDNLQDVLNQEKGCNHSSESEQSNCIKRNPRVADIPTVYLVTCIKTEYVPKKIYWDIYSNQSDTNQSPEKSNYQSRLKLDYKSSKYMIKEIIKNQDYLPKFNEKSCTLINKQQVRRNRALKPNQKNLRNQYEREWKTEYLTFRCHQFEKNEAEKKKLMHKQIQTYKIETKNKKKKKKSDRQNSSSQFYIKRILNILDDKQNIKNYDVDQRSDAEGSWRDFFIREHNSENKISQDLKYVIMEEMEEEKPISTNENRKKKYSHYQSKKSYRNISHDDTNRIRNVILVESCIRMKQNLQIRSMGSSSNRSSKKRMRIKFQSFAESEFERQERVSRKKSKLVELIRQKPPNKYFCGKNNEGVGLS